MKTNIYEEKQHVETKTPQEKFIVISCIVTGTGTLFASLVSVGFIMAMFVRNSDDLAGHFMASLIFTVFNVILLCIAMSAFESMNISKGDS